jgi:nucleoside-diphosphate-sugar epimerase
VNVCSGVPTTLREVIFEIADYIGARDLLRLGAIAAPGGEPPLLVGDACRLSNDVCWHGQYDLEAGILQTVESWRAGGGAWI